MKRIILIDDQYENLAPLLKAGLKLAYEGREAVRFDAVPFKSYHRVSSLQEYDVDVETYLATIPEGERAACCVLLDWVFMYTDGGVNKAAWHGRALFDRLVSRGFQNVIIFSNYTEDEEFRKVLLKNGLCLAKPSPDVLDRFQQKPEGLGEDGEAVSYFRNLRLLAQSLFFDEQLDRYGMLLGSSPEMREVAELIDRAAASDVNVLILGDTGTGKELTARAIHNLSDRRDEKFLTINCSGIPSDLLETELFGYAPGTFTDQVRAGKPGLLREADGGTVVLDEIGDMPLLMQSKLLRFLQDHRVRPVGSITEYEVNVRVVCSTNRNLRSLMEDNERTGGEKGFRSDLFWRIRVLEIKLPSLADRFRNDRELLHLLFYHHLRRAFKRNKPSRIANLHISAEAEQLLLDYYWPGNFREFENVILGATALLGESESVVSDNLLLRLIQRKANDSATESFVSLLNRGGSVVDVPRKMQRDVLELFLERASRSGKTIQAVDLVEIVLGETKASSAEALKKQTARVIQYLHRRNIPLRRHQKRRTL
jgi:DNA-binding NtrC family response regulator